MALLTRRRRGTRLRRAPTAQETPGPRPARSRRRRLMVALLLLATCAWFLPAIAAHTPLLRWIVAQAASQLSGTVTVKSASLGWFSPIAAYDVEIHDIAGEPVLQVAKLTGDRSLAAILWNSSKLGQFRLEQPKLSVLLRDDGSNVEDVLENYLVRREEPSNVDVALEVVDGSVSVTDRSSRRTWQIEKLELSLSTSADAEGVLQLETSATVPDPQHPGRFAARLALRQPDDENPAATTAGELKIESEDVPLAMFESLIGRFAPRTQLSGRLSCKIDTQFGGEAAAANTAVQADLTAEDLALSTPWLGTDRVQLRRLRAACQAARQQNRLEIKESSVDCDLGNASLRGSLDLGDRRPGSLPTSALQQTYEINGHIDLARLAQMLPGTLRIRKEAEITSGQVQLALTSSRDAQGSDPQGMVWRGRIEAGNLKAVYRGRQLTWEQPILLTLAAHEGPEGPVVESLKCESDFLKLHAAGTPRELAASASFNLKELADQLGQFVDLGGISLGGDGWAHFHWARSQEQRFEADAELQLRNFQLAMPQRQPWAEGELSLLASASGRTDLGADTQLHAASLEIKTSTDHIQARLTQPVLDFRGGGTWPLDLQAQGNLQNWPARLARWFGIESWIPSGAYALSAQATASTDGVTGWRSKLTVEQLHLRTASLNVEEPHVELVLSGNWEREQRRLQMEPATL
jgi:translocation and assembly module TamB